MEYLKIPFFLRMTNWQTKPLGDLCHVEIGKTPYRKNPKFWDKEKKTQNVWLSIADLQNTKDKAICDSSEYISNEGASLCKKVSRGTLLASFKLTLGRLAFANRDLYTNEAIAALNLNSDDAILNEYLYYYLTFFDWNAACKGDVKVKGKTLNKAKLKQIPVCYPESLPEQKRIVSILDQAFEAIEKAKKNAEKNLQNAKELFESVLWSINAPEESLGTLVDIKTGKLDANAAVEDGQYPFFTCSREASKIDYYAFDCEAILLAGNNAVGDFNVKHYKGKFNAYQRTYVITVNNDSKILYRYLYFQMLKSLKAFKTKSVGAGTKFLRIGMIKDMQIALPSINEQKAIIKQLDETLDNSKKLDSNYNQKLSSLDELKQSLLSKAFNGEL